MPSFYKTSWVRVWGRDGLPIHNRISDIAVRIANISEAAILREGGEKMSDSDVHNFSVLPDGEGNGKWVRCVTKLTALL